MKVHFRRLAALSIAALIGSIGSVSVATSRAADDLLTIGSDAPLLDIEHWVQDGEGKFGKVTKFKKDNVYVVEFWATWCGPCVASMPHIVEMQSKYADKGVQIISISDEPLDTVQEFLDRDVPRSKEPKTFRELTKSYSLTTDPDGSSNESYMQAAKQNGIGHPMELDAALDAVVEGTWDRAKFAEEFKESQEMQSLMQDVQIQVGGLLRKKKMPEALAKMDEFIEKVKKPEIKLQFSMMKLNLHQIAGSDDKEVASTFESIFKLAEANPMMSNQVAWMAWEMSDNGQLNSKETLKAALVLARAAAEKQEGNSKAATLDTVSHLEYSLGNLDAALKLQQQAMELADDDQKESLKEFLQKLKDESGVKK